MIHALLLPSARAFNPPPATSPFPQGNSSPPIRLDHAQALVSSVPIFLTHTEAQLVSHDISPTGCITTVFADNRAVCAQVR